MRDILREQMEPTDDVDVTKRVLGASIRKNTYPCDDSSTASVNFPGHDNRILSHRHRIETEENGDTDAPRETTETA